MNTESRTHTLQQEHASTNQTLHRALLGHQEILVTENEPLLVQLERAGIIVEYQCR